MQLTNFAKKTNNTFINNATEIMGVYEFIGVLLTAVSITVGCVVWLMKRSFKAGELTLRLDSVENKTQHANCKEHHEDITAVKSDIRSIKNDVVMIKSLLTMKYSEAPKLFSIKHSPRQLNKKGEKLLEEIKGLEFLQENKKMLFSAIDKFAPKTALDVENASLGICVDCAQTDIFNKFKNYIYNAPSYIIKDSNGNETLYDLTIPDICFVLSIPLRDMYLHEHHDIIVD